MTAGKNCGLERCYLSSSDTIGPPPFFTPSRIGRGGPFFGTVTSTHSSSPGGRRGGPYRRLFLRQRRRQIADGQQQQAFSQNFVTPALPARGFQPLAAEPQRPEHPHEGRLRPIAQN